MSKAKEKFEVLSTKEKPIDLKSSKLILAHRKGMRNQILVVVPIFFYCMVTGVPMGFPAILLPQLLGDNTTDVTNEISIDTDMGSWIASISALATPLGAFISGPMTDFLGRRNTLIISIFPLAFSWCIQALARSYYIVLLARFLSGLPIGIIIGPAQVYISEVAEPKLRGLLNCTLCVMFSTGILLVYILGAVCHWRVVSWLGAILSIMTILPLCFIPESPFWLVRNNKMEKAFKALKILRGHETIAEEELKDMQKRLMEERAACKTKENIFQLCSERAAYKPLTIVTVFSFLQLFTGNLIFIAYASDFMKEIGSNIDINSAVIASAIGRNLCNVLFSGIVMVLPIRTIISATGISSGITSLVISIFSYAHVDNKLSTVEGYVICAFIILYVIFNTPMMIIPAIITGELLPGNVRGRCAGFVHTIMSIELFGIIKLFPDMQIALKLHGVFLVFTIANFACTLFMYLFQPETKCRTLNEIEDYFNGDNWLWSRRDRTYKQVKQTDLTAHRP